jgi:pyruvate-ferredoxin/flavodoxin oxidoreductase
MKEARYAMLARANPEHAEQLLTHAQHDIENRWRFYEQMAGIERGIPDEVKLDEAKASEAKA